MKPRFILVKGVLNPAAPRFHAQQVLRLEVVVHDSFTLRYQVGFESFSRSRKSKTFSSRKGAIQTVDYTGTTVVTTIHRD